ncbi:hypothetical protein S7711_04463, partial [Stachybotrys chartarum IBT 7711]
MSNQTTIIITNIIKSTGGAFGSVPKLWNYSTLLRPFVAWQLPALQNIRGHRAEAKSPVLDKRLKEMEDPDFKSPPDLIQLVIDGTKGQGRSLDYQVNAQFGTGRAALFTTGLTVTHLLYDLVMHPEYIEVLREEVLSLGPVNMSRVNVAKLERMDSFIREFGTIRKVLSPLKLPDGTVLPVGTVLGVDSHNAIFNNSTLENPGVSDGLRFYNLRAKPGNENKYQAVAPGPDHLVFGYGTQACPGRFFAIHEAKVVLARILEKHDFKLKKPHESPMAGAIGILTQADATCEFLFRKRQ